MTATSKNGNGALIRKIAAAMIVALLVALCGFNVKVYAFMNAGDRYTQADGKKDKSELIGRIDNIDRELAEYKLEVVKTFSKMPPADWRKKIDDLTVEQKAQSKTLHDIQVALAQLSQHLRDHNSTKP